MEPLVNVIVPVHSVTRPVGRAVASVVDHTEAPIRVSVVAHDIDPAVVRRELGVYASHPDVRVLPFADGIPSPAGPFNHGLDASTGKFVSVMGSDDEYQPGAIDNWLDLQRVTHADIVIARIVYSDGAKDLSPPTRPARRRQLHPIKDRLAYRSAPLGLVSRTRFGDLRFARGLPSGEDLIYVARLWFSGARIAFARYGPAYLGHTEGEDRVSAEPRPLSEDFAFLDLMLSEREFAGVSRRVDREAMALKLIRVHLFDAVVARASLPKWPDGERERLAEIASRILAWSPRSERLLSRVDHTVLDLIRDPASSVDEMMALLALRWDYRHRDVVLTRNPIYTLHRQGPWRTYLGGYLL